MSYKKMWLKCELGASKNSQRVTGLKINNMVKVLKKWPNGDKYEGTYQHGKKQGEKKFSCESGDYYEGEWEKIHCMDMENKFKKIEEHVKFNQKMENKKEKRKF